MYFFSFNTKIPKTKKYFLTYSNYRPNIKGREKLKDFKINCWRVQYHEIIEKKNGPNLRFYSTLWDSKYY